MWHIIIIICKVVLVFYSWILFSREYCTFTPTIGVLWESFEVNSSTILLAPFLLYHIIVPMHGDLIKKHWGVQHLDGWDFQIVDMPTSSPSQEVVKQEIAGLCIKCLLPAGSDCEICNGFPAIELQLTQMLDDEVCFDVRV